MTIFNVLRVITTLIASVIIAMIAGLVGYFVSSAVFGIVVFLILFTAFILQAIRLIPPAPPRKGIPTFLGDFISADTGGISIGPGYIFLPLFGLLFGYVPYDASEINLVIEDIKELTPDGGSLTVDAFFTYRVDQEHPVWFIRAGDKAIVEKKLEERVDGRLREWISSENEGPLTWPEARQSNGLAMDVMIQKLFPRGLDHYNIPPSVVAAIPDGADIPLSAFIKYVTGRPQLSEDNPQERGVKASLDQLKISNRAAWNTLRQTVRERNDFIESVKGGECAFPIPNLGIIVTLASLGSIDPDGSTAAAADRAAGAVQDARVETIKSDNFQTQVEKFATAHGGDMKAATEAIQLLRGLIKKDTQEKQYAIRADNLQVLRDLLGPALISRLSGNNPQALYDFLQPLLTPLATATSQWISSQAQDNNSST